MLKRKTNESTRRKPLRLWPGVVIVILQWLVRFVVPIVVPEATVFGVIGGLFGGLAIVVWWAFFSRAPRPERWGAVVLMIVAVVATSRIIHESIATSMMGMMFAIYATPVLSLAFVVWAVVSRHLSDGPRRATMVATILLACRVWTLLRSGGFTLPARPVMISRGDGRRLPRSGSWPKPATSRWHSRGLSAQRSLALREFALGVEANVFSLC